MGVHHKTDRRVWRNINYSLASTGVLQDFVLLHLQQGHDVMCSRMGIQPNLFMSSNGGSFDDALFTLYWGSLLIGKWIPELPPFSPYFPPSKARNIYVDYYTSESGALIVNWARVQYL